MADDRASALEAMHSWLIEQANEGRSPRTITAYEAEVEDTLRAVAALLGAAPHSLALSSISRDHLVAAVADFRVRPDARYRSRPHLAPPERAPATVARRVAALKVFFSWCYATERIPADPAALIKAPRKTKRLPKALDAEVARELIERAEDARWPERDQLLVVLALTTGLRLEEIARLRVEDLVGNPSEAINVIGKGNKERRLPLAPVVQEALAAYLPTRSARLARLGLQASTLFISTRPREVAVDRGGAAVESVEATRAGIAYVVDRVLRRVGARRRGSRVHVLRHTFATLGLRPDSSSGRPAYTLRQLQAALGHANLATIQVYAEVSDAELKTAAAAHPLARATRPDRP
ncbi:MAG: tyrosine-type recombinase/integrase [Actinomycetota bacterium]